MATICLMYFFPRESLFLLFLGWKSLISVAASFVLFVASFFYFFHLKFKLGYYFRKRDACCSRKRSRNKKLLIVPNFKTFPVSRYPKLFFLATSKFLWFAWIQTSQQRDCYVAVCWRNRNLPVNYGLDSQLRVVANRNKK